MMLEVKPWKKENVFRVEPCLYRHMSPPHQFIRSYARTLLTLVGATLRPTLHEHVPYGAWRHRTKRVVNSKVK